LKVLDISRMRTQYFSLQHPMVYVITVHETMAVPEIHRIVKGFAPDLVIELGTGSGGMTLILHETNLNTELHSFDIGNQRKPVEHEEESVDIFNQHVIFHVQDILFEPSEELIKLCQRPEKKLLYCDGGDKIKEVLWYASQLNEGDMLGIHDYGTEVKFLDIQDVILEWEEVDYEFFYKHNLTNRFWIKRKSRPN